MKNIVITIGREYGSGGRYIGEMVAKKLGIPFYDKELILKAYEKNGCNYSKLEEFDENKRNIILKTFSTFNINNTFPDDMYQELIHQTVSDVAKQGSCVILGRNSNNILKNKDNVISIFIYSNDLEFKVKRKMDIEKISYDEALSRLKKIDKQRKKYYEYVNKNSIWGAKEEYDFCLDSSILGIEQTVELIIDIYNKCSSE